MIILHLYDQNIESVEIFSSNKQVPNRSVFNFQIFVHERYDYVWKPAVGKSNESMLLRQFKQNIKSIDL